MTGRFHGVGVGPGDPELITRKAARLIEHADVVAYHAGVGKESNARRIAAELFPPGVVEEQLTYPVTTGATDHPGGYAGALADFYEESAARLAAHLDAGRDVVLLAEGDPLFYGSYMHLHFRLGHRYPTEVIPGVTSLSGCWSAAGLPLARGDDVLSVVPGTLDVDALRDRLAGPDAIAVIKVGRNLAKIREAVATAGRLDGAVYVERGTMIDARIMPLAEKTEGGAPYFAVVLVPALRAAP